MLPVSILLPKEKRGSAHEMSQDVSEEQKTKTNLEYSVKCTVKIVDNMRPG